MNFSFWRQGGMNSCTVAFVLFVWEEGRETKGSPGTYLLRALHLAECQLRLSTETAHLGPPGLPGMLLSPLVSECALCSWSKEGLVPWMHLVWLQLGDLLVLFLLRVPLWVLFEAVSFHPSRKVCAGKAAWHTCMRVCTNTECLPSSPGDLRDPSRLLAIWWRRSPPFSFGIFVSTF